MRAFFRILLGDAWNVAVVAVIVAVAIALTTAGYRDSAVYAIPVFTLGGVALLTRR